MKQIITFVKAYLGATTLEERERRAAELLAEIGPPLSRYIRSKKLNAPAEDILQVSVVKIFENLIDFEGTDDESFWAWCYRITRNNIIDSFRGRIVNLVTVVDPELLREALNGYERPGTLSVQDREDFEYAIELIKMSEATCRECLLLRFYVGLSFRALGEELGITEEAAIKRVTRCIAVVQKLVKSEV